MASLLVKILLLVFILENKNRSYTEKVKYPLSAALCLNLFTAQTRNNSNLIFLRQLIGA